MMLGSGYTWRLNAELSGDGDLQGLPFVAFSWLVIQRNAMIYRIFNCISYSSYSGTEMTESADREGVVNDGLSRL